MPWRPWDDLLALVELAAPSACAGCATGGHRWCPACDRALTAGQPGRAWAPTPPPPGLPATWVGPAYEGVVRSAVVAWKDGGRADLTPVLARVVRAGLAAALEAAPGHRRAITSGRAVLLVPAPSTRASTRARGEHRVRRLAETAARRTPGLVVVPALALARPVVDQAGLGAGQRWANLAGAVRVSRPGARQVVGAPCILVDDVVTTGATLTECARALRAAGSGPVVAVTVAATPRRSGSGGG